MKNTLTAVVILVLSIGAAAQTQPARPKPCSAGNLETYSNTSCTLLQTTYTFPAGFWEVTGNLAIRGADITIRPDTSGNGPYTLLVASKVWNPPQGKQFHLRLTFTVKGGNTTSGWIHGCGGSATAFIQVNASPTETAITTCRNPRVGARYNVPAGVPAIVGVDLTAGSRMDSYGVHFNP